MLLILDNRDSFVFNLDQALRALGAETRVVRSDRHTAAELANESFEAVVLSPGPGRPEDAGCLLEYLALIPENCPVLGVCLGHQALAVRAGANIVRADEVVHGRCSVVRHDGRGIFEGVENPIAACRYHSLVLEGADAPPGYEASAWTEDGKILMAMRHVERPWIGLQFHPESFRTPVGPKLIENFLALVRSL